MRIIPKTSKVKLTFYKGITVADMIIGFISLLVLAITLSSNLWFRWYIALGIVCLVVPLYLTFSGERLYQYIGFIFKYLASRKKYTKGNKNEQADITGIIPYKEVKEKFIVNRDGSFVGVLEICPIDFRLLSADKQDDYIEGVFARVINNINIGEQFSVVKLERPLILDGNITDELDRLNDILKARENEDLNQNEYESRINVIQDRITLIDTINSGKIVNYSKYYLCLIGKNENEIDLSLDRAEMIFNGSGIQVKRLKEKELVAFIRYGIDNEFDERELDKTEAYGTYLMPRKNKFQSHFRKARQKESFTFCY